MTPERAEEGQRGLSRERLVGAALDLIQEEGLEGLTMRALAESLQVKAASLYWHVRDREELLELLAEGILESVRLPSATAAWRPAVLAIAAALAAQVIAHKAASRVLLDPPLSLYPCPTSHARNDTYQTTRHQPTV